jgi:hypothetical protein
MHYTLNSKERNAAFFRFFASFLVTIVFIVGAIYFNFRLPIKQSEHLKETIYKQQKQDIYQEKFAFQVNEVKKYIDSLDKEGSDAHLTGSQLSSRLEKLQGQLSTDNKFANMNQVIVETFYELIQAKQNVKELTKSADLSNSLQFKLDKCEGLLDGYRQQALHPNIQQ